MLSPGQLTLRRRNGPAPGQSTAAACPGRQRQQRRRPAPGDSSGLPSATRQRRRPAPGDSSGLSRATAAARAKASDGVRGVRGVAARPATRLDASYICHTCPVRRRSAAVRSPLRRRSVSALPPFALRSAATTTRRRRSRVSDAFPLRRLSATCQVCLSVFCPIRLSVACSSSVRLRPSSVVRYLSSARNGCEVSL